MKHNDIKRLFGEFTYQYRLQNPVTAPSLSSIGAEMKLLRDEERELMKIHHQKANPMLPRVAQGVSPLAYFRAALEIKRAQRHVDASRRAVSQL